MATRIYAGDRDSGLEWLAAGDGEPGGDDGQLFGVLASGRTTMAAGVMGLDRGLIGATVSAGVGKGLGALLVEDAPESDGLGRFQVIGAA